MRVQDIRAALNFDERKLSESPRRESEIRIGAAQDSDPHPATKLAAPAVQQEILPPDEENFRIGRGPGARSGAAMKDAHVVRRWHSLRTLRAGHTWEKTMPLQQMRKTYDPNELTYALARVFSRRAPTGFIVGRTLVRDTVADLLDCSPLEADEVVDTLILRGRLVFVRPPEEIGAWTFRLAAQC